MQREAQHVAHCSWRHSRSGHASTILLRIRPRGKDSTALNRFPGHGNENPSPSFSCSGPGPTSCTLLRTMSHGCYYAVVLAARRCIPVLQKGIATDTRPTFAEVADHLAKDFIEQYQGAMRWSTLFRFQPQLGMFWTAVSHWII